MGDMFTALTLVLGTLSFMGFGIYREQKKEKKKAEPQKNRFTLSLFLLEQIKKGEEQFAFLVDKKRKKEESVYAALDNETYLMFQKEEKNLEKGTLSVLSEKVLEFFLDQRHEVRDVAFKEGVFTRDEKNAILLALTGALKEYKGGAVKEEALKDPAVFTRFKETLLAQGDKKLHLAITEVEELLERVEENIEKLDAEKKHHFLSLKEKHFPSLIWHYELFLEKEKLEKRDMLFEGLSLLKAQLEKHSEYITQIDAFSFEKEVLLLKRKR